MKRSNALSVLEEYGDLSFTLPGYLFVGVAVTVPVDNISVAKIKTLVFHHSVYQLADEWMTLSCMLS